MAKPFLTYTQQIQKLKDKRLTIEDDAFVESVLHQYGYFALVSGYKDLLKNPTTKNYKDGTTICDIIAVYRFDEQLRNLTLHYISQVERHIRSTLSYAFCSVHGEAQCEYLNAGNYDVSTRQKNREVTTLINRYLSPLVSRPTQYKYIEHHKQNHQNVPLWVLVNALTFGTLSKMYEYSQSQIQAAVSMEFDGVNEPQLRQILEVLTDFRNKCAHSERLFTYRCAKHDIPDLLLHRKLGIAKNGQQYICGKRDYFSVVLALRYLLPHKEFLIFKKKLAGLLDELCTNTDKITQTELYAMMGLPQNWKKITSYKKT